MQIYRGLDIGTGKATPHERARASHHLIDICDPEQQYSAAQWAADANRIIGEIRARGKTPIVCGGTGFYIQALVQPNRLASAPPNFELRQKLEARAEAEGNDALHEYLRTLDEGAAARLHPNDRMRVMRAIEVALSQDAPQSTSASDVAVPYVAFGIQWPREVLYERIEVRIDQMLADGFLEELRTELTAGHGDALPLQNLGYKQMRPVLHDAVTRDECLALWKRDTRRYAKRQMTWFRNQLIVRWLPATGESTLGLAETIAKQIAQL
jgi:tRNA dimethylallyltransferase